MSQIITTEAGPAREQPQFGHAVSWSYAMEGGRQFVALGTMLVLARLLGPATFGIAALAAVYLLFIRMMLSQGLAAAIIQRKDLAPEHLDAAFWLVLAASGVLTGVSVALAGWWASLNSSPELQAVVVVLSVLIPLQALVIVQESILRRNLDFRSLALRTSVSTVAGGAVAISAAVAGAGVWALVVQQIVTEVLGLALLWKLSAWRPRWRFSAAYARQLLGFSTGSFLATIGVFLNNRADTLLVGLFFGPVAVGVYRLASRLADTVVDLTVRALQAAAFPMLSRLQHDPEELSRSTIRILRVSALVALPPLGLVATSADPITALLGPEWSAASIPLTVLCVAGGIRALSLHTGPVLQAVGRPHLLACLTWVSAALSALALVAAGTLTRDAEATEQLLAMSSSRVAVHATVSIVSVLLLRRIVRVRLSGLSRAILPTLAGVTALVFVTVGTGRLLGESVPALLVQGVMGLLAFTVMMAALDKEARETCRRLIARVRGAHPAGSGVGQRGRPSSKQRICGTLHDRPSTLGATLTPDADPVAGEREVLG